MNSSHESDTLWGSMPHSSSYALVSTDIVETHFVPPLYSFDTIE